MSEQTATREKRRGIQRRMAIQRGVEQAMNRIIRDMRDLVDESRVVKSRMEKHQIGNVLAVALETPSVELVKNFILYQAGRDVRGSSWRRDQFGDELVGRLDNLREDAESIAREVHDALMLPEPGEEEIEAVWIELVRQYLGQLNRYFYYKKEAQRW
jgi:hypothetical protein